MEEYYVNIIMLILEIFLFVIFKEGDMIKGYKMINFICNDFLGVIIVNIIIGFVLFFFLSFLFFNF